MTDYLREAFQKLQVLNEEDFNLEDETALDDLTSYVEDDIPLEEPEETEIIDVEANDASELQDNYIGKVILECSCCHTRIYKDEESVYIDEETELANADEECPVCNTMSGYMVIGKIEPFDSSRDLEAEAEFDTEPEGEPVEDLPFEDDDFNSAFDEVGEDELSDDDFGESLEEEMLEHGNENLGASDNLAVDDTLSLEDDQTELVHAADENVPSLTEEKCEEKKDCDEEDCLTEEHHKEGEHEEEHEHHHEHHHHHHEHEEECHEAKVCEKCGKEPCECEDLKEEKNSDKIRRALGIVEESLDESVTVDINNGTVTSDAGEATIDMNSNTVSMGAEGGTAEMIAPLEASDMETIDANIAPSEEEEMPLDDEIPMDDEAPVEDEMPLDEPEEEDEMNDEAPVEIDDMAEESFNYVTESYLRRVYENVDKFEATSIEDKNGQYVVEGLITFVSGKQKPTQFVFESAKTTKRGKVVLEGYNETFSTAKKSFVVKGILEDKKYVTECLTYNYSTNVLNESKEEKIKVSGVVRAKK